MNRLGPRDASLLRLPACVGSREADAARPVAGGPRVLFREEEDPVGDIAAPGDGAQRGGAVETPVDAATAVATQCPWLGAGVQFAVRTDKYPGLAHRGAHSSLLRVMENDPDRVTMPGTDTADPMPQIDPIDPARPLHRTVMDSKSHGVALP